MINEAVIEMTNTDNPNNNIKLCMICYNDFTAEQLLRGRAASN
ncbi:MAG: hypothetical protein HeimC2_33190 [Candidatus Heimdallarchaeota archaeon LC_2]|nr:MAG: hypothetical protein HeimC2_33190 [Candidatus Heimdallarchaeota archaeon LC_2]